MEDLSALVVRPATLAEAVKVHARIPEFDPHYITDRYQAKGIAGKNPHVVIAEVGGEPAGYMISHEELGSQENTHGVAGSSSLYMWLAGVVPEFRQDGVFSAMTRELSVEAKARGLHMLTVKSYPHFASMLKALAQLGFEQTGTDGEAILFAKKSREVAATAWLLC